MVMVLGKHKGEGNQADLQLCQRLDDFLLERIGKCPSALDLLLTVLEDLAPGTSNGRQGVSLVVLPVGRRRR